MTLAGYVLPQPQVLGSKAVDGAIAQLDVDLPTDHGHPTAPRGGMNVRKLGRRIHLQGASRAGLKRLQYRVVLAERFDHAFAVGPCIHSKEALVGIQGRGVSESYNRILSSSRPKILFFKDLKNELGSSDHMEAEDPGIQQERATR